MSIAFVYFYIRYIGVLNGEQHMVAHPDSARLCRGSFTEGIAKSMTLSVLNVMLFAMIAVKTKRSVTRNLLILRF